MNITMEEFPELKPMTDIHKNQYYQEQITQLYFLLTRKENDEEITKIAEILHQLLSSLKPFVKKGCETDSSIHATTFILLYKMIAQTRDIVFGKGERKLTYMMIMIWYKYYPILAIYALYRLVDLLYLPAGTRHDDLMTYLNTYVGSRKHSFGCWKDIKYFCYYIASNSKQKFEHPLIDVAVSIMNDQVMRDCTVLNMCKSPNNVGFYENNYSELRKYISFVGKWVPREKTKFEWVFEKLALDWSRRIHPYYFNDEKRYDYQNEKLLNKCKMDYRKILSELNRILDTVEVKQCSQKWDEICVSNIPSGSMTKHKNALLNINGILEDRKNTKYKGHRRICSQRIKEYYKDLTNPENTFSFHGIRNELGHYVKSAHNLLLNTDSNIEISQNRLYLKDLLNKQMDVFIKKFEEMDGFVPFVDCFDDDNALYGAIELAYIIAIKSSGRFMKVNHSPGWCELIQTGDCVFIDNIEKIIKTMKSDMNHSPENILNSMDIFIKSLVDANISNDTIHKMVLVVITNKEYICNNDSDIYNNIIVKFKNLSLDIPHILFWNLSTKSYTHFPIVKNLKKTTIVSGKNALLLNHFRFMNFGSVREYSAYNTVCNILANSRFDIMENYIRSFLSSG
jgi:hypothetical protein